MPSLPPDHASAPLTLRETLRPNDFPDCIITGCDLVTESFWQHGDLFQLGDVYVFNACGEPEFVEYRSAHSRLASVRYLEIAGSLHRNYFERRNVYVVAKSQATLSPAAREYVEGAPR